VLATPSRSLGRHVEPALWLLIALDGDPLGLSAIFDAVRALDCPIGHGTLVGALSRLERLQSSIRAFPKPGGGCIV
jgi:hypothetical protein